MAEQQYDLFFSGQILEGYFVDFVKSDIQSIFKADQQYVDLLFSGTPQPIKRKVDKATAIKYQQAFKKAGAKLIVTPHKATAKVTTPTTKPAESSTDRPKQSIVSPEFQTTQQPLPGENADNLVAHHQPNIEPPKAVPHWEISAPGVILAPSSEFIPADIDTSELSLANAGADLLVDHGFEAPAPNIDTSLLTLASVGATLDILDDKPAPVKVDISHLSLY